MTDNTTQFIAPENAEKVLERVLSTPQEPATGVAYTDLPDTHVTLPGGYLELDGTLIKEAEVRELNGYDEEAIARAGSAAKVMMTLLQRAVVAIGGKKPDQETLNGLLAGDRDTLLLAIRRVTFGNTLEGESVCPECGAELTVTIDLVNDVETRELKEATDRDFVVDCAVGKVQATLPTGTVQRIIANAGDKNMAELNSILLRHCVISINDLPVFKDDQIKALSLRDREKILLELADRNPGPRLHEVKKECASCEKEIEMPLTLASLFRL